ncbi:hypothetical protein NDN08_003856 [Rhodosorus marinus]|uniref:Ubiquitin-like domain-containing protein n=1 Tax=Rhodosorus marinus TaxID=101924 RepID=A0AAV8UGN6_9RHOD|nr:hypothetical protein NDN08_003856 [Rhodosorus marinus]
MKFVLSYGKERWDVDLAEGSSVGDLRSLAVEKCGLAEGEFSMICKGKRLLDSGALPSANSRIMILSKKVGSTAEKPKTEANTQTLSELLEEKKSEESGERQAAEIAPEGFHVALTMPKARKIYVVCELSDSYGHLRDRAGKELGVNPASLKLIWKGRARGDTETLTSTGVSRTGTKILVLFSEGYYDQQERTVTVEQLKSEAAKAVQSSSALLRQFSKRLVDKEELLIRTHEIETDLERLSDNLKHSDPATAAPHQAEIDGLMKELETNIDKLRRSN